VIAQQFLNQLYDEYHCLDRRDQPLCTALQFRTILSACICVHLWFQFLADPRPGFGTARGGTLSTEPSPNRDLAVLLQTARKKLEPQMHADARRCTQMDRADSDAIGHSVDFDARLTKIEQQTKPQVGRLEVIDALCGVYAIQRFHCLQFYDDGAFDQHVSDVFSDNDTVVTDHDPMLLRHTEADLS
jgi:hypothetical protein